MRNSLKNISDRKDKILAYINQNGRAEVETLAELFHTSTVTIRRDLDAMASDGLIIRTYGGASCIGDIVLQTTPVCSKLEKTQRAIAAAAAKLIDNDDIVFINSSTTASYVLEYIESNRVTIVSNNSQIVNRKRRNPDTVLIITGGQSAEGRGSLTGPVASAALDNIRANKTILGVRGISSDEGITSSVAEESHINQLMIRHTSGPVIIVAENGKLGKKDSFFTSSISSVNTLVTNEGGDAEQIARLHKVGVKILEVTES